MQIQKKLDKKMSIDKNLQKKKFGIDFCRLNSDVLHTRNGWSKKTLIKKKI